MKQLQIAACVTNEFRYWWETSLIIASCFELLDRLDSNDNIE